jgi:prepilin-type N-terminal cleavage/methylation domain-containing protein
MNRRAFTLTEILICIVALCVLAGLGGLVYVIIHFIAKVW